MPATRDVVRRQRRVPLAEVPATQVRPDIQGLRAVAVLLVIGYHLWPNTVAGGFVGVDVFFVISGFLITSHLLRRPPTSLGGIVDFWGRRLRRLLPASLLVIAVTVAVGCLVLPVTQLAALTRDAIASTFYVENWNLAASSVDYLAIGAAPSPLQHYWSLGVEEQFYLVWPFVVAGLALLAARRRASPTRTAFIGLAAFAAASLVVSVVWTSVQPSAAYFVTPTRLWELAAGGVLAAAAHRLAPNAKRQLLSPIARALVAWAGLVLIAVSVVVLNGTTPFPGVAALLPVVGAVLFIAADSSGVPFAPTVVLGIRPAQFVGDTSYSLYLWHYPVIVLATAALARPLGLLDKAVILVACVILAQLTRKFVEDPVRRSRWLSARRVRTFGLAALSTVVVVAIAIVPTTRVDALSAAAAAERHSIIAANAGCFGAAALVNEGCSQRGTGLIPSPAQAPQDVATAYADGCFAEKPFATVVTCQYGDPKTAKFRVALVGNSHAVQWLPALQALAPSRHLLITTFVASGCMPTSAHVLFDTQLSSDGCRAWGKKVIKQTSTGRFDLVVTSVASNSDLVGIAAKDKFAPQTAGYTTTLRSWADAKVPVLVIRDTPLPEFDIPSCVAQHVDDTSKCDGVRSTWLGPDPMIAAAQAVDSPEVKTIDLTSHFCSATTCFAVIGGVIVYFDFLHVGATFITSAAPYLSTALDRQLRR